MSLISKWERFKHRFGLHTFCLVMEKDKLKRSNIEVCLVCDGKRIIQCGKCDILNTESRPCRFDYDRVKCMIVRIHMKVPYHSDVMMTLSEL